MKLKRFLAVFAYVVSVLLLLPENASAQAIYGPNGQYQGMAQTSGNTTNFYNSRGDFVGSVQNSGGQANMYNSQGSYQGYIAAPMFVDPAPTTNMYIVPQVPQVPHVRQFGY